MSATTRMYLRQPRPDGGFWYWLRFFLTSDRAVEEWQWGRCYPIQPDTYEAARRRGLKCVTLPAAPVPFGPLDDDDWRSAPAMDPAVMAMLARPAMGGALSHE